MRKHHIYIICRIINWIIVFVSAIELVNLIALISDQKEVRHYIPAWLTLFEITVYGVFMTSLIVLWFYPQNKVTRVKKIIGVVLGVLESVIWIYATIIWWNYRQTCIPSVFPDIPIVTVLIINVVGLIILHVIFKTPTSVKMNKLSVASSSHN